MLGTRHYELNGNVYTILPPEQRKRSGRDRIVVSTSRCGRDNPGSNPGHGINRSQAYIFLKNILFFFFSVFGMYLSKNRI